MKKEDLKQVIDIITNTVDEYGVGGSYPQIVHHTKAKTILAIREAFEEKTYAVGDHFSYGNVGGYVIAACGEGHVALLNVDTGRLWRPPLRVWDMTRIVHSEFKEITGGHNFTRIRK